MYKTCMRFMRMLLLIGCRQNRFGFVIGRLYKK